jgi:hypothetical protein
MPEVFCHAPVPLRVRGTFVVIQRTYLSLRKNSVGGDAEGRVRHFAGTAIL